MPTSRNSNKKLFSFGAGFLSLAFVTFLILGTRTNEFFGGLNYFTAQVFVWLLRLLGIAAQQTNDLVSYDNFQVQVITECSALYLGVLFCCFVIAFPSTCKEKGWGIILGLTVLFLTNQVRLVSLFLVGIFYHSFFNEAHIYLGQVLMIGATFFLSLAYVHIVAAKGRIEKKLPADDYPSSLFLNLKSLGQGMHHRRQSLYKFALRFLFFGIPLFWIWSLVYRQYLDATRHIALLLLATWGFSIESVRHVQEVHLQAYNIVTFISLLFAASAESIQRKIIMAAVGITGLWLIHVFMEICFFLIISKPQGITYSIWLLLNMVGQYMYPFIFWFCLTWFGNNKLNQGSFQKINE